MPPLQRKTPRLGWAAACSFFGHRVRGEMSIVAIAARYRPVLLVRIVRVVRREVIVTATAEPAHALPRLVIRELRVGLDD